VRAIVLTAGLAPAAALLVRGLLDALGADPVEEITHQTGQWALRFLVLTLAVTPARRLLRWSWLAPERRTFGLLAFGWASLHFATWLVLDRELDLGGLASDLAERPYITAGFTALVAMLPLALTSTRASMRRLGRRWVQLHRLVYVAAIAACLHYLWLVKADLREPAIYTAIVATLLALRSVRRSGRGRS
jgi:sulfoxide reductase heme-binding subunit YedZ